MGKTNSHCFYTAALAASMFGLGSVAIGCGDDSDKGDDGVTVQGAGTTGTPPSQPASDGGVNAEPPAAATAATFAEVNMRVFATGCAFAACHAAKGPMAGLDLETDPYGAIMNVASPIAGSTYVVPFDAEASYLFQKIASDMQTIGTRMPPTGALSEERIALVRSWINAGAKQD